MPTTLEQVQRDQQRFLAGRIFERVGNGRDATDILEGYRRDMIESVLVAVANSGLSGSQQEHEVALDIAGRLRTKLLDDDDR